MSTGTTRTDPTQVFLAAIRHSIIDTKARRIMRERCFSSSSSNNNNKRARSPERKTVVKFIDVVRESLLVPEIESFKHAMHACANDDIIRKERIFQQDEAYDAMFSLIKSKMCSVFSQIYVMKKDATTDYMTFARAIVHAQDIKEVADFMAGFIGNRTLAATNPLYALYTLACIAYPTFRAGENGVKRTLIFECPYFLREDREQTMFFSLCIQTFRHPDARTCFKLNMMRIHSVSHDGLETSEVCYRETFKDKPSRIIRSEDLPTTFLVECKKQAPILQFCEPPPAKKIKTAPSPAPLEKEEEDAEMPLSPPLYDYPIDENETIQQTFEREFGIPAPPPVPESADCYESIKNIFYDLADDPSALSDIDFDAFSQELYANNDRDISANSVNDLFSNRLVPCRTTVV